MKAFFVMLNSCEEASSEEMVDKSMDFSTEPATTLLIRNPRRSKTLTARTENFKLEGESITAFYILLEQQASILEVEI